MIWCRNISKTYNCDLVLKNFNYYFEKGKMYFIYGRSGSGKTTLLNIICGLVDYDSGFVSFEFSRKKYYKKVDNEEVMNNIAYISQNTYLINYLSVYDNLILCNNDENIVISFLKEFNLLHLKDKMPNTLSGGEKQRIAIMQAILMNKNILLLDEPTASLDYENKIKVFELLYYLKNKVTILISSHDVEIEKYCDEVIDLENQKKYNKKISSVYNIKNVDNVSKVKKAKLEKYMAKQFNYSKFEKKEIILQTLIFVIAILICFLCGSPQKKLLSNIDKEYKVNQLQVICNTSHQDICNNLLNEESIKETVVDYAMNIEKKGFTDGKGYDYNYEITLLTIPYFRKYFKISDRLLAGNYFEDDHDIILSYDYALSIVEEKEFNSIIGTQIKLKLENGEEIFKICGVFDKFEKNDYMYFQSMGLYPEQVDYNIFLNSKFTQDYYKNPTHYFLFFDNFQKTYEIYNKYLDNPDVTITPYENSFNNIIMTFNLISYIFYPLGVVGVIVSLLFYFQRTATKLEYYKSHYCTFNYYGYNSDNVKRAFFITNIYQIMKQLSVATILSCIIGLLLNKINDIFLIFSFRLFDFNYVLVLIFYTLVIVVSTFTLLFTSKKIKKIGWYNILQETRDII